MSEICNPTGLALPTVYEKKFKAFEAKCYVKDVYFGSVYVQVRYYRKKRDLMFIMCLTTELWGNNDILQEVVKAEYYERTKKQTS